MGCAKHARLVCDAMADPTADDETRDDAASDDAAEDDAETAESDAPAAPTKVKPTRKRPDPKADVAARREATKARMDAEAKDGTTRPKSAAVSTRKSAATAADPTGAKARRARKESDASVGTASADDPTGAKARREAAASAKKVARPSKRTGGADTKAARTAAARSGNPKRAAEATDSARYTAPIPRSQLESPMWVPVLMFVLLGLGGVVILLTYVVWGGRPLALGVGLALILGGILTATQYR